MVRTWRFYCRGLGSIPGGGTKTPQASRCSQKKKKESWEGAFDAWADPLALSYRAHRGKSYFPHLPCSGRNTQLEAESRWLLGGRRIRGFSQLGHLPGASGAPRTPKGTGGTPSDQVGCGASGEWRGRRSGGGTGPAPLKGG